jgi:hypothetical protein
MTAKERRYVRKLEIENEELRRHFDIANSSNTDTFLSLYETRFAMRLAYECLVEAVAHLEDNMRDDPAFMQLKAQVDNG